MAVEMKDVDLPMEMKRAMAKQAEVIEDHTIALQLRYLQAMTEIATEKNSTILFPVPRRAPGSGRLFLSTGSAVISIPISITMFW
jgi:hypothetical protein